MKKPAIIAHRGSSMHAHENSMAAFRLAIEQKADMIELDTHLTKDGYFIVYHDYVVKTDQTELKVSETKLEDILAITLPNGEHIPLLEDVLRLFLSKIEFNIEIKCSVTISQFDALIKHFEGQENRIIVSSFDEKVLNELQETSLDYSLAFLYVFPRLKHLKIFKKESIEAFHPYYRFLTGRRVKLFHTMNKTVNVWTVNSEQDIRRILSKKVDGIITDNPLATRKIVNKIIAKTRST